MAFACKQIPCTANTYADFPFPPSGGYTEADAQGAPHHDGKKRMQ